MSALATLAVALVAAGAIAYFAVPRAIKVAYALDFVDRPGGYKGHAASTPYLGGSAVILAFIVVGLILAGEPEATVPVVGGALVMWGVGTLDDRRSLSPGLRVVIEVALAAMLWAFGLGWNLELGSLVDLAFTVVWIVAVVNAFNLFDNMDGAAGTIALVASLAVGVLGVTIGDLWLAAMAGALAGACIGFLPYNLRSPARIFLGDGGSMPVGFAIASLVMIGASQAAAAWQSLMIGLLLVGLPAIDSCLVVVSRRRRGVPVLAGGRDHLTHRTFGYLRSTWAVALALGSAQALLSVLVITAVPGGSDLVVWLVLAYLVTAGVAIVVLERSGPPLPSFVPEAEAGEAHTVVEPEMDPTADDRGGVIGLSILAIVSLGAALSPFAQSYYSETLWVPIGLGLVIIAVAGLIARPPAVALQGVLCLVGLFGVAIWALLSTGWGESAFQATVDGNRWLMLAAVLTVGMVLIRNDWRAAWVTALLGAGIAVVAIVVLGRMLGPNPESLFIAGRLHEPLGYINGEACMFVMGFWICLAAAEHRLASVAGAGAAAATLLASLVVLSETRGAALAVVGSVAITLLVAPGRVRRSFALLVVGAAVAAIGPKLLDVYSSATANGPVSPVASHSAAAAMLLASVVAGVVWCTAVAVHNGAVLPRPGLAVTVRRCAIAALCVVAVAGVGAAVVKSSSIESYAHRQYDQFVHLTAAPASQAGVTSRLASGSGNRYDYWRIAWQTWKRNPIVGVGAGNYDVPYFRERATPEDIRQPHSVELQMLSELGLVGAGFLLLFVLGLGVGVWRMRPAARESRVARGVMVASVGGVTTWLVQASVDWMHLLPGVTAVALLLTACLVRRRTPPSAVRSVARYRAILVPVIVGVLLAVAGASLSRQGLADIYRERAKDALATDPAQALVEANRSLNLEGESTQTYYIKAAALARFNLPEASRAMLLRAERLEPHDFLTWALLGDLATRVGQPARARAAYRRAKHLNPRQAGLVPAPKSASGG